MNDLIMKRINGKNFLNEVKANKIFICFYFFVVFSFSVGVLLSRRSNQNLNDYIAYLFNNYYGATENYGFFTVFFNSFFGWMIYAVLLFVSGVSALGYIFVPVLLFFKIMGYGLISGYLYSGFGLNGISFYLLTIVPGLFICLFCFCFAAKESFAFSRMFFKTIKKESKPTKFHNDFKLFSLRYLIFAAVLIVANLLDAVTGVAFSRFFNL